MGFYIFFVLNVVSFLQSCRTKNLNISHSTVFANKSFAFELSMHFASFLYCRPFAVVLLSVS